MNSPAPTLESLVEEGRKITYGVVKPGPEVEGGVPFVRGGDVFQGRIASDELRTISPRLSHQYRRTLLRGGELLVSLVGNPGEVAIVPPSLSGANIARQVGLVPLNPKVDARFVMYYLRSPKGRGELFTRTQGAVQQVINLADLKKVRVPFVQQEKQKRIADILSAYDDLIENNRRRIQLLEQAARLLYKEWFVHFRFPRHEHVKIKNGVPDGWEKKPLGEIGKLNYGKALRADNRVSGPIPVYGSSGVVGTHVKALVEGPGIIVGRKGNVGSVYWSDSDFFPIDTVYFIESASSSFYLYYSLLHTQFISTDVAVPGLNRDFAHSRRILLAQANMRSLFEELVTPIHAQISTIRRYNEVLSQARDLLLPRLMNGEIAV